MTAADVYDAIVIGAGAAVGPGSTRSDSGGAAASPFDGSAGLALAKPKRNGRRTFTTSPIHSLLGRSASPG